MIYDEREGVNQGQHKHRIASPVVKHLKFLMRNTGHARDHVSFRAQCPKEGQQPTCMLRIQHPQYKWKQRKSHPARSSRNRRTTSIRSICWPVIRLRAECHRYKEVNHHPRHILASPRHPPKKKTAPTAPRITTPNAGDQYRSAGNRYPR